MAKLLDISASTVFRWKKSADRSHPQKPKTKRGRPQKLSKEQVKLIKKDLSRGNRSLRDEAKHLLSKNTKVSPSTISRSVKRGRKPMGFKSIKRKPMLTAKHK